MRFKAMLVGLVLGFALVAGCKQQCYVTEPDLEHYRALGLTQAVECTPGTSIAPEAANVPAPTTILDPDRQPRFITLKECISVALEKGTIGSQSPLFPGIAQDAVLSFGGTSVGGDDSIRVLAMDPALVETNIESSLSKFDARWVTSLSWNTTDRPVGTALDTFQASRSGNSNIQIEDVNFTSSLLKPLPTGGVAGITFGGAQNQAVYELSNLNPLVNPSWRPAVTLQFEQPLLQGFGVDINQLRASHPGSQLTPYTNSSRVEGILITRLRFDEERTEFERNINFLLVNVEYAYWTLYDSYWTLYSREQALRQAFEAWRINKARYEAGRIPIQDLAQSRGQYELFRGQRITALGQVLENERQLRGLMGLKVEDCSRLIPIDEPTLAPYVPDWCSALVEAENLRPELTLARQDLKFRQLDLINQKNLLLPDVRFFSTYDWNALGSRLDGSGSDGAFHNLGVGNFSDWSLGIRAEIPIGFRDAHAGVRAARLNIARSYNVLRDQELKVQRNLAFAYRRIFEFYAQIEAQRAQREAYAEQLEARFREFLAGRGTLDFLLESQRNWADALRAEYDAIAQYNSTLALFQFQKGTIMQYDNVVIGEGQLPHCAQCRAAEHQEQKARSIVLHERPLHEKTICNGNCGGDIQLVNDVPPTPEGAQFKMPEVPSDVAPSVSSLYGTGPNEPLPNNGKALPRLPNEPAVVPGTPAMVPGVPTAVPGAPVGHTISFSKPAAAVPTQASTPPLTLPDAVTDPAKP
jgi:outer membrane protein TolC